MPCLDRFIHLNWQLTVRNLMSSFFHGKEGILPEDFLQALPEIDLDRIAFGFHYFPETGFADFFACDQQDIVRLHSPAELQNCLGYSGFVAFPFQTGAVGYLIPPLLDLHECMTDRFVVQGFFREEEEVIRHPLNDLQPLSADDYQDRVKKAVESIDAGNFEKVVLSRSDRKPFSRDQLSPFLSEVFQKYAGANLMVFNIPGKGFWISASPEVLLAYGYSILGAPQASIVSHALAGTRPAASELPWDDKELHEQSVVARFIRDKFAELVPQELIQQWGPGEQQAGNLKHLSSIFHVRGGTAQLAVLLLNKLHPTPAVCGFPYDSAYGWLIEHEKLDRSFFSGFSGSFHPERMKFIVNLRTACFRDDNLLFFAGAGIMKDSDPSLELQETEAKMDTLRSLI
jgi:isochorismate synthase